MGQSLAKVSLVATMATLLQHFSFKLAEEVSCSHSLPVLASSQGLTVSELFFDEADFITLDAGPMVSCRS